MRRDVSAAAAEIERTDSELSDIELDARCAEVL